jgi:hypothetical protein
MSAKDIVLDRGPVSARIVEIGDVLGHGAGRNRIEGKTITPHFHVGGAHDLFHFGNRGNPANAGIRCGQDLGTKRVRIQAENCCPVEDRQECALIC